MSKINNYNGEFFLLVSILYSVPLNLQKIYYIKHVYKENKKEDIFNLFVCPFHIENGMIYEYIFYKQESTSEFLCFSLSKFFTPRL